MTFYKSRKFAYAFGGFLAALLLAAIPQFVELDPATEEMVREMLPVVAVLAVMLITGHTVTDVVATWRAGVEARPLGEAAHLLIDAIAEPDSDETAIPYPEFKAGDKIVYYDDQGAEHTATIVGEGRLREFTAREPHEE